MNDPIRARMVGENYIQQFFTIMQLMELLMLLMNPSTPPNQLAMVQSAWTWIKSMIAAWMANPDTFDPKTFGNPPHSYLEIISTTN